MKDNPQKPRRRHILRSLILFCLLLLVAAFGVSYALGWISFHQGDGTFTIQIRTGKAKQDTDHAVKQSKDATVGTGKVLQRAGKKLEELGGEDEVRPPESTPIAEPAVTEEDQEPHEPPEQTENDSP